MLNRTLEAGFGVIGVIVMTLIFIIIGATGYAVWLHQTNPKTQISHATSIDPNTGSFSDCAIHRGEIGSNNGPSGSGGQIPPNSIDPVASGLLCRGIGSVTKTEDVWFANDESNFDVACKKTHACTAILGAANTVCSTMYGAGKNTYDPSFLYLPVVMNAYAKLQLTDCSANHYRGKIIGTLFMTNTNGEWHIYKFINANSSCASVDYAGLPPELTYKIACQ